MCVLVAFLPLTVEVDMAGSIGGSVLGLRILSLPLFFVFCLLRYGESE